MTKWLRRRPTGDLRATSCVIKAAVQVGLLSLELLERKKAPTN